MAKPFRTEKDNFVITNKPIDLPTLEDLERAWKTVDAARLHYYQLLYFQQPKLTSPGHGVPFHVAWHPNTHCLEFSYYVNPQFNFLVLPTRVPDDEVLRRCQLILSAEAAKKIHSQACCPLAVFRPCVCAVSFSCELHGKICVGSHD